ncbi:MAG: hypothetical protein Q8P29_01630 [Candidatus Levybacteria bacterium]|nr:hypothetical protein [Candidatus Levybacteria bacterium]
MRIIEAGEIRNLSRKLREATDEWDRDAIRAKLDKIADERKFDGSMVIGDDGADSDGAIDLLQRYGTFTVADSFSASYGTLIPAELTYTKGMTMLGLPDQEVERLAASFEKGHFPTNVIDAVVNQQKLIQTLHPDKYPFEDTVYDVISNGLSRTGINTEKIWRGVTKNLIKRGRADLALEYGYDPEPTNALTGFLAHYALTKHNIGELNRTKRELHF